MKKIADMAQIIAVANLKGGVGKSTIAVNLACCMASHGISTALVDSDSQGTSSFWQDQGDLPVTVKAMPLEDRTDNQSWVSRLLSQESNEQQKVKHWKRSLASERSEVLIIDCPPHGGLATKTALSLADLVLVPVTPTAADIAATAPAINLIHKARQQRRNGSPQCLIVPSRVDRTTSTGRQIEMVLKKFGEHVGPALCARIAFADSVAFGRWVGAYKPGSPAHLEVQALVEEVCTHLDLGAPKRPKEARP